MQISVPKGGGTAKFPSPAEPQNSPLKITTITKTRLILGHLRARPTRPDCCARPPAPEGSGRAPLLPERGGGAGDCPPAKTRRPLAACSLPPRREVRGPRGSWRGWGLPLPPPQLRAEIHFNYCLKSLYLRKVKTRRNSRSGVGGRTFSSTQLSRISSGCPPRRLPKQDPRHFWTGWPESVRKPVQK